MLASKVTEKYQATIPNDIRHFLHLRKGDKVIFNIEGNKVVLKKLPKLHCSDYEYLNSLTSSLSEWSSLEDDEAYDNL